MFMKQIPTLDKKKNDYATKDKFKYESKQSHTVFNYEIVPQNFF